MRKVKQLSECFENSKSVLIFCDENDTKSIFGEWYKEGDATGSFDRTVKIDKQGKIVPKSVYINSKTFHFISKEHLDTIIDKLENLEI